MSEAKPGVDDWTRTGLGWLIGGGGFAVLIVAYFKNGLEGMEGIASVVLGLIGTVVGYYFGSRGADRAETQASISKQDRDEIKQDRDAIKKDRDEIRALVEETRQGIHGSRTRYNALRERYEVLRGAVSEYEHLMERIEENETLKQSVNELLNGGDDHA